MWLIRLVIILFLLYRKKATDALWFAETYGVDAGVITAEG